MPAGRYNFIIEGGTTFRRKIIYKDSLGNYVDLTGWSAKLTIKESYDSSVKILTLSSDAVGNDGSGIYITPTSGVIEIVLSAKSSSMLSFDRGVYDLVIQSGSGDSIEVRRLLEGLVKYSKNVTDV